MTIIVLNDGSTYTDIKGCIALTLPDDTPDGIVEDIIYDHVNNTHYTNTYAIQIDPKIELEHYEVFNAIR